MKSSLAALALGLAALIVQGALARSLPPPWCPDLALLVVIGIGLRWPGFLAGLLITLPLGYAMDLVSGSLMGQHAFLRVLTYMAAAVASRQLDLSGTLPVGVFVFGATMLYGLGIGATLMLFVGAETIHLDVLSSTIVHAIVNVIAAAPMIALVERVIARFADDEVGRRGPIAMPDPRRSLG